MNVITVELSKMTSAPGDVVVLRTPHPLEARQRDRVIDVLREVLPAGVKTLVLCEGIELEDYTAEGVRKRTHVAAPSKAVGQIMRALNLPANTVAFTLKFRENEIAVLEVETTVKSESVEGLATALTQYRLEEIEQGPF